MTLSLFGRVPASARGQESVFYLRLFSFMLAHLYKPSELADLQDRPGPHVGFQGRKPPFFENSENRWINSNFLSAILEIFPFRGVRKSPPSFPIFVGSEIYCTARDLALGSASRIDGKRRSTKNGGLG